MDRQTRYSNPEVYHEGEVIMSLNLERAPSLTLRDVAFVLRELRDTNSTDERDFWQQSNAMVVSLLQDYLSSIRVRLLCDELLSWKHFGENYDYDNYEFMVVLAFQDQNEVNRMKLKSPEFFKVLRPIGLTELNVQKLP